MQPQQFGLSRGGGAGDGNFVQPANTRSYNNNNQSDIVRNTNLVKPAQAAQQSMIQNNQFHSLRSNGLMQQQQTIPMMSCYDGSSYTQNASYNGNRSQPIRQVPIGSKDLIIRMLAEVFHVSHGDDGQPRWEQVSSSLVPVSLYSRTTSKWLDYMLAASAEASSGGDPASAMSPDSREFLLLMQKFHASQQHDCNPISRRTMTTNHSNNIAQQQMNHHQMMYHDGSQDQPISKLQEGIVFQIIGHDFINGQCKKILNVKLVQLGTRLGQASDYFIYWKEQANQSTYNHSMAQLYNQQQMRQQQQQAALRGQRPDTGRLLLVDTSGHGSHTWGLNFASVNDAKLFYDICSLNLVDLDFNSEYLKQLTNNDRMRQQYRTQNLRQPVINRSIVSPISPLAQQQQSAQQRQKQFYRPQDASNQSFSNLNKYPTYNSAPRGRAKISPGRQSRQGEAEANQINSCPVHGHSNIRAQTLSTRSRSSTRIQQSRDNVAEYRTRSFSTPASPDGFHPAPEIEQTNIDLTANQRAYFQDCLTNTTRKCNSRAQQVPVKPARGLMRADMSTDSYQMLKSFAQPTLRHHHEVLTSNRALHSKRSAKTRYLGYLHSQENQSSELGADSFELGHKFEISSSKNNRSKSSLNQQLAQKKSLGANHKQSRAEDFDSISRRDARLARARYANSKRTNEFLSLDAGAIHSVSHRASSWRQTPDAHYMKSLSATSKQTDLLNHAQSNAKKNGQISDAHNPKAARTAHENTTSGPVNCPDGIATEPKSQAADQNNDSFRNVSTTTEDLPIDAKTRQRMLNLASEEAISERTEPKSLLNENSKNNPPNVEPKLDLRNEKDKSNNDQHLRAVSLGPEIHVSANRDRSARSEAGRRRSFERGMCIDLDSSFPTGSSLRFTRLFGQNQSPTSKAPPNISEGPELQTSKTTTSCSQEKPSNDDISNAPVESQEFQSEQKPFGRMLLNKSEQNESDPHQSYQHGEPEAKCLEANPSVDRSSCRPSKQKKISKYNRNTSGGSLFKSEPDFNQLAEDVQMHDIYVDCQAADSHAEAGVCEQFVPEVCDSDNELLGRKHQYQQGLAYEHNLRSHILEQLDMVAPAQQTMAKQTTLSSYAVPLCTSTTRRQRQRPLSLGRQCYSCPNSLRRKRRMEARLHGNGEFDHGNDCNGGLGGGMGVPGTELVCVDCVCRHCERVRQSGLYMETSSRSYNAADPLSAASGVAGLRYHAQAAGPARPASAASQQMAVSRPHKPLHERTGAGTTTQAACPLMAESMCYDDYLRCRHKVALFRDASAELGKCQDLSSIYDNAAALRSKSRYNSQREQQQAQYHHHHHHYQHRSLQPQEICRQSCCCAPSKFSGLGVADYAPTNLEHLNNEAQITTQLNDMCCATNRHKILTHSPRCEQYRLQFGGLGNRSPLHYGLYESEYEDEDPGERDSDEEVQWNRRDCDSRGRGLSAQPLSSAHRSYTTSLKYESKPVQGYDQTLARASLRLRQRSRSQPPARDAVMQDSLESRLSNKATHLSKSMENVEKLIKEVQNELDAMRRYPIGTAQINLRGDYMDTKAAVDVANIDPLGSNRTKCEPCYCLNQVDAAMYVDLGLQSNLQPYVRFDWRLVAERGLRCYGHFHDQSPSCSRTNYTAASCEIDFLLKVQHEELEETNKSKRNCGPDSILLGDRALASSATKRAGQFKCVGAIRKAGFLSVKKWILKRRNSIELARRQGWKRYWVCLRGTALLFHSVIDKSFGGDTMEDAHNYDDENLTDLLSWIRSNFPRQLGIMMDLLHSEQQQNQEQPMTRDSFLKSMSQCYIEREPRHLIIIDGSIAQPIPEHPRREFVFCLSTTFGDAYFFQASCQLETDNWISAIHNACAASIARDLTRDETIKLFENKIRHLELDAEKKLFLRQRLDSRLTSTLSISGYELGSDAIKEWKSAKTSELPVDKQRTTMRSLLYQLTQQLVALDTYIEQVNCEIYQLRCYLSSCNAQNIFFRQSQQFGIGSAQQIAALNDLPHPKSLLMHVSRPTKLLLLKLGVFTVSSFHAFIHARQDSADTILQRISLQKQQQGDPRLEPSVTTETSRPLELRIRSQSISESLLLAGSENKQLQNETEELLELANLRAIRIQIKKDLFNFIRQSLNNEQDNDLAEIETDTSDDRYSIRDGGDIVVLNLKLNPKSNLSTVIKQVLAIIEPNSGDFDFLDYCLNLVSSDDQHLKPSESLSFNHDSSRHNFVGRNDKLEDWPSFIHAELRQKLIYRTDIVRCRINEEASLPFGISIEGRLISGKLDNLLDVYCSYVEWGSVADKASLIEEDEFLMINGIPVADLDLMFVECLLQDASRLRLVVRSSRLELPYGAKLVDRKSWQPDRDEDGDDDGEEGGGKENNSSKFNRGDSHSSQDRDANGTHIISDEYLTSLVCPPPPTHSSAFLRIDQRPVRQRSDLGDFSKQDSYKESRGQKCQPQDVGFMSSQMSKSKSQHKLDDSLMIPTSTVLDPESLVHPTDGCNLTKQLLLRTERLTRFLARSDNQPTDCTNIKGQQDGLALADKMPNNDKQPIASTSDEQNNAERLRKCLLELLETEYAYIKQLETINEHYMVPLSRANFLNIHDLKTFHNALIQILEFQRHFFHRLLKEILSSSTNVADDDFDRLGQIVQSLEDHDKKPDEFLSLLQAIARVFFTEADKFRLYAAYCIAYSKLQRILHPKSSMASSNLPCSSIISIPPILNTFSNSTVPSLSRDHVTRPISTFSSQIKPSTDKTTTRLKNLTEFLSNLDSSSSSLSISSLARSSSTLATDASRNKDIVSEVQQKSASSQKGSSSSLAQSDHQQQLAGSYQKNVHQQNFESYLIKPIQRIVKYPMLLSSILQSVSHLQRPIEEQSAYLQDAVRHMESVICLVNDIQKVHDEYGFVLEHIERQYLYSLNNSTSDRALRLAAKSLRLPIGSHQQPISLDIDGLLHFGPVAWLNVDKFKSKAKKSNTHNLSQILLVFNSCVVFICKEQISKSNRKLLTLIRGNESANSLQTNNSHAKGSSFASKLLMPKSSSHYQGVEVIRYQTVIPVNEVQVRSVASSRGSVDDTTGQCNEQYCWELFQCSTSNSNSNLLANKSIGIQPTSKRNNSPNSSNSGCVYQLACNTSEERSHFLRKIRFIIRESVRNMSVPLGRSPTTRSQTSPLKKDFSPTDVTSAAISAASSRSSSSSIVAEEIDKLNQQQPTTRNAMILIN